MVRNCFVMFQQLYQSVHICYKLMLIKLDNDNCIDAFLGLNLCDTANKL